MTAWMAAVIYLAIGGALLAILELDAERNARRAGIPLGPCNVLGLALLVVAWPVFLAAVVAEIVAVVRARRGR